MKICPPIGSCRSAAHQRAERPYAGVVRSAIVRSHAQACHRIQQILGGEIGADFAGGYRGRKKFLKCRLESLVEVRGQVVEGRVSECRAKASPRLVPIKAAYRCIHFAGASPGLCSSARALWKSES